MENHGESPIMGCGHGGYFLTNKNDGITGISWDKCGTPNNKPTIFGCVCFFSTHKHSDFGDGSLLVLPHECSFVWFKFIPNRCLTSQPIIPFVWFNMVQHGSTNNNYCLW